MRRFHKPGDEKRMVAILDPADHDAWLTCRPADAPACLRAWAGNLLVRPDPLVRPPRTVSGRVVVPPSVPDVGTDPLF